MKARVIKIISNQFTILFKDNKIKASLSGKMRLKEKVVLGDYVEFQYQNDDRLINDVYPRKNILYRPSVANIDQVFIVMSCMEPEFDYKLVNRLILFVEYNNIKPILLISKSDLNLKLAQEIQSQYQKIGYESLLISKFNDNEFLKKMLKDKISVLAGQSGTGKSSLMNILEPKLKLKTQEISKALNRGKHTTTHHELYEIADGFLADTPGFSNLSLKSLDIERLKYNSTFLSKFNNCKYQNCSHIKEPDCCLKNYLQENGDSTGFYQEYLDIILKNRKEQKW